MSSGMSSDRIIKMEIQNTVLSFPKIRLRIFPDSSNQDQLPVASGGLTFSHRGVDYGSCDAGWFQITENGEEIPLIALEGTDALNRGSAGDAQYQRFHHALGAVKNGVIGIYYLRSGTYRLQPDLYEMAYNVNRLEPGGGFYLIVQDLRVVNHLLAMISRYGRYSATVLDYLQKESEKMHAMWLTQKFSRYHENWEEFANSRSTVLAEDSIIKYSGRMKRNFTDPSQRAGHIAVGEMYLSKYLFFGKTLYYLWPRMTAEDVAVLDRTKSSDKEWFLLRHESNVFIKTRDDLENLPDTVIRQLESIHDAPLKSGSDAKRIYNACIGQILQGLKNGTVRLRK